MSLKKNNFYQKYFSELALSLARINKFITKDNPSVGCVVIDFNNNIDNQSSRDNTDNTSIINHDSNSNGNDSGC